MSILDELPFELKQVILEYARPSYLNDILKTFETNKYDVSVVDNFEIVMKTLPVKPIGLNNPNVSIINTNKLLYIMNIINDKDGFEKELGMKIDLRDYIIELGVIILHELLLKLDLYQYTDDNFKTDNMIACKWVCDCDFPRSEYLNESYNQLEQLNDDQIKSILVYHMKHY